jgi:hypothetical protein
MTLFGVSKASFFDSLWGVFVTLTDTHPIIFDMCRLSASDFMLRQSKAVFKHVVGAVDGVLIACTCLSAQEYHKPAQFWTRKGYYAFNVQAVCNAHRCIMFLAVDCPGTCHYSLAFSMSTLGQNLYRIPRPYYILTDTAYKAFDRVLVPY